MAAKKTCTKCGKTRIAKQYKTVGARVCTPCQTAVRRSSARKKHLAETYSLTPEEYDQLLAAQHGACAICGGERSYNLQVDHCHKTGKVRGLLCKTCNKRLLPAARDRIYILGKAIDYLEYPPARPLGLDRVAPIHTN